MALRNGPAEFGSVTRALHWTMAVLVIGQLALGLRIVTMTPGLSGLSLYGCTRRLAWRCWC